MSVCGCFACSLTYWKRGYPRLPFLTRGWKKTKRCTISTIHLTFGRYNMGARVDEVDQNFLEKVAVGFKYHQVPIASDFSPLLNSFTSARIKQVSSRTENGTHWTWNDHQDQGYGRFTAETSTTDAARASLPTFCWTRAFSSANSRL